jgi:Zn-dependent protease with chaperone function
MIEGRYFFPHMSASHPARLSRDETGLAVALEGEAVAHSLKLVSLSDKLGNVPRKFTFEDGGVFEAFPGADVDSLMGTQTKFFTRLSGVESNLRLVIVCVMATVFVLLASYRWGIPLAARVAAESTPTRIVNLMDTTTLDTLDKALFKVSALPRAQQEPISRVFAQLQAAAPNVRGLSLQFRDGGKIGPNAFALPGGTVVITDQLIKLAKNEDEIAGVLAHEIGHVEHNHSLQQLYRMLGFSMLVLAISGDASQIVDQVMSQATVLQQLAYSREFETDADFRSVELMLAINRDPLAFTHLLMRLQDGGKSEDKRDFLSTHPNSQRRMDEVKAFARRVQKPISD